MSSQDLIFQVIITNDVINVSEEILIFLLQSNSCTVTILSVILGGFIFMLLFMFMHYVGYTLIMEQNLIQFDLSYMSKNMYPILS